MLYFAYGIFPHAQALARACTAIGAAVSQVTARPAPALRVRGPAWLPDVEWVRGPHPPAGAGAGPDLRPRPGQVVPGVLLEADGEALDAPPRPAGAPPAAGPVPVTVLTDDGRAHAATAWRIGVAPSQAGADAPAPAFFVYGTLMQGEANHPVVARHGLRPVRTGWALGDLYDTGRGYPALRAPGRGRVRGELLLPRDREAAVRDMDHLEEFAGYGVPGNEYERRLLRVQPEQGGAACLAWTYLYAEALAPGMPIASGDWRQARGAG